MKAPDTLAIPQPSKDSFTERARVAQEDALAMARRSFTIRQADLDHVTAVAVSMTQQSGKVVSASEALRHIIDAHRRSAS